MKILAILFACVLFCAILAIAFVNVLCDPSDGRRDDEPDERD